MLRFSPHQQERTHYLFDVSKFSDEDGIGFAVRPILAQAAALSLYFVCIEVGTSRCAVFDGVDGRSFGDGAC